MSYPQGAGMSETWLSFRRGQGYSFNLSNTRSNVEVEEMTLTRELVTVWTDGRGRPERLVVGGARYRVSDTPTVLESDYDLAATHPLGVPQAWRFQGTDEDGRTLMFEVRPLVSRSEWLLLRTYQ
jgi:hypothetical protein